MNQPEEFNQPEEPLAAAVEFEEDILGDLLGGGALAGDAQGEREDHALVGLDQSAEFVGP